jgi:hypothetical protein
MPDDFIIIKVTGLDKLTNSLNRFPQEINRGLEAAGKEVGKEIINTRGLRLYPPATAANMPPTPYYIRGRGTETKHGNIGNSERYGTQFWVEVKDKTTTIGNRASYAKWLAGDDQARAMARIGWRKLWDVAIEKKSKITEIYQKWINYTIKKLGL